MRGRFTHRARIERLLTLLQLDPPPIRGDAPAPIDVPLEVGAPFIACESAAPFLVLLLLLDRELAVHLAIGLGYGLSYACGRSENDCRTAGTGKAQ
ncbi:hypothetical protein [Hyphomicrobium sp.]|uniref:hypothetical protein n=1 Tax=Hyphomicrobium sp. TaxID=82 RepID=UPI002CDDCBAE|nr:hypothetical protein [Hyphomicrobium sp.]HRN89840.1 hypothetical protein [Hyphomicrobium sp.]HRQ25426.1 hypothetical protein [Hyphomicrobium sp.]